MSYIRTTSSKIHEHKQCLQAEAFGTAIVGTSVSLAEITVSVTGGVHAKGDRAASGDNDRVTTNDDRRVTMISAEAGRRLVVAVYGKIRHKLRVLLLLDSRTQISSVNKPKKRNSDVNTTNDDEIYPTDDGDDDG